VTVAPQTLATRRLTDAEALMWALDEDPALRAAFMGVTYMKGQPDVDRFRRKMEEAVETVEVLRQRVAGSAFDLGSPHWEVDPGFDLDYHVRRVGLPSPGSHRQLLDLAAVIYADPFDRNRPLWKIVIVEGLEGGHSALLAKMHHVLSDGIGAIRISVSFLDLGPEPADTPSPRPARTADGGEPAEAEAAASAVRWFDAAAGALAPILSGLDRTRKSAATMAGAVAGAVRSPADGVTAGLSAARSIGRQVGLTDQSRSPLWSGQQSNTHRFEELTLDLGETRATAKRLGGTVNDVFVTTMAAAAGAYHRHLGVDVAELRMSMPISVRHDHEIGGNAWVPSRLLVPTGDQHPIERFGEVALRLAAVKREPSLGMAASFAGVVRRLPPPVLIRLIHQQVHTVDFACSNVRGAPFDLWISGAHVLANHPLGPTAGVAFNATIMSYKDSLNLGLNVDAGAISDPGLLRTCIVEAFAELTAARP